ncbi:hypothetical protein AGOR_G00194500 [Albula goreensis]|uniref:Ig-like domain-containing protein n=1 Tax=Albula goreensis TaxID=1534307 RepID=A0A8T3CW24_9TELE|nr:hypothetical protein AGOR_G00194500 [Albula goreensis]
MWLFVTSPENRNPILSGIEQIFHLTAHVEKNEPRNSRCVAFHWSSAFICPPCRVLDGPPPVRKTVGLGQSVLLPCSGAAGSEAEWYFKQRDFNQWLPVANLTSGGITPKPGFEGRLKSVHMKQPGNYSLILSPVVHNDGGIYECRFKNNSKTIHSEVIIDISDHPLVSMAIGEPATLPCFGNIGKQSRTEDLHVKWEKDRQPVCQFLNSKLTCSPGFENRASLSINSILEGNLSLTITPTRSSDEGDYQCFYNKQNDEGTPASVSLAVTAHPRQNLTVQLGDSLPVPVYTSDPVNVMFGPDEVLVASVKDGSVLFGLSYAGRDAGVYSIREQDTGRTIGTVCVQVADSSLSGGAVAWIVIGVLAAVGVVGAGLCIVRHMCLKEKSSPDTAKAYQRAKAEDEDDNCQMLAVQSDGQSSPDLPLPVCETQPDEPPPSKPFSSGTEPFTDETETFESEAQRFVTEQQGFVSETERPSVTETQLLTAVTGPDSQTPVPEIGFSQPETAAEGKADYDL